MSQATVALSGTAQSVIALIQKINGHQYDQGACCWLNVRAHDSNGGPIYLGDCTVTTSNYGIEIVAGDSRTYNNGGSLNNVDMTNKFLIGSGLSADLEWEYV